MCRSSSVKSCLRAAGQDQTPTAHPVVPPTQIEKSLPLSCLINPGQALRLSATAVPPPSGNPLGRSLLLLRQVGQPGDAAVDDPTAVHPQVDPAPDAGIGLNQGWATILVGVVVDARPARPGIV